MIAVRLALAVLVIRQCVASCNAYYSCSTSGGWNTNSKLTYNGVSYYCCGDSSAKYCTSSGYCTGYSTDDDDDDDDDDNNDNSTATGYNDDDSASFIGAIVGTVFGVLVIIALVIAGAVLWQKKQMAVKGDVNMMQMGQQQMGQQTTVTTMQQQVQQQAPQQQSNPVCSEPSLDEFLHTAGVSEEVSSKIKQDGAETTEDLRGLTIEDFIGYGVKQIQARKLLSQIRDIAPMPLV